MIRLHEETYSLCPSGSSEYIIIMADKGSSKLVIIGDGAVGKTCLMDVFEKGEFVEMPYRPTVFHNTVKSVEDPTTKEQFNLQL